MTIASLLRSYMRDGINLSFYSSRSLRPCHCGHRTANRESRLESITGMQVHRRAHHATAHGRHGVTALEHALGVEPFEEPRAGDNLRRKRRAPLREPRSH